MNMIRGILLSATPMALLAACGGGGGSVVSGPSVPETPPATLSAVDTASIVATRRLGELASDLTDDEVTAQLNPVVRRYILAN